MKIYVASSWKNNAQPWMCDWVRRMGHEVYDFRNTKPEGGAFNWDQIDPAWEGWNISDFMEALDHPLAEEAFRNDHRNLSEWADVGIMVMPCGASSHLEIGYMAGMGKPTAIYMTEGRAELMYKEVDLLTDSINDIRDWLEALESPH